MTRCFLPRSFAAAAMAGALVAVCARAQVGGPGPTGMSSALTKLFGNNTAFAAKGEMEVTDTTRKEVANWPMDFALLDRKIRVEIDLTQSRNPSMNSKMAAMLKQIGMAEVISIIRPDKKVVYVIYPDQQAMISMPLPKEDVEDVGKGPKVAKTPLGKENIDGHPCTKNKVVVTDANGQTLEAITWDASDLKDLPIQIQTQDKDVISLVRFKNVQFARPAPGLFEPPRGFTQYDNQEDLKVGIMKKMVQGAEKK